MYQGSPVPRGIVNGCRMIFVEMKYFKEHIIREHINRHLIYDTTDKSAVAVDIYAVTLKKIPTVKSSFTWAFFLGACRMPEIAHHGTFRGEVVTHWQI
jgi:hypothetical protein